MRCQAAPHCKTLRSCQHLGMKQPTTRQNRLRNQHADQLHVISHTHTACDRRKARILHILLSPLSKTHKAAHLLR